MKDYLYWVVLSVSITALLVAIFSCATMDPYFVKRVATIKKYCEQYGHDCQRIDQVTVSFGDMDKSILARCYNGHITVNKNTWSTLVPTEQEVLLLHEYGHCAFNKDDIPDYANRNASIMYPSPTEVAWYYWLDKQYYLTVLFF